VDLTRIPRLRSGIHNVRDDPSAYERGPLLEGDFFTSIETGPKLSQGKLWLPESQHWVHFTLDRALPAATMIELHGRIHMDLAATEPWDLIQSHRLTETEIRLNGGFRAAKNAP
jgi:hypothetical protein